MFPLSRVFLYSFLISITFLIPSTLGFPVTEVPDPQYQPFDLPDTVEELDMQTVIDLFIQFEAVYHKEYMSPLEQAKARAFFQQNVINIIQLNQKYTNQSLEFGVNFYSDFSDLEFSEKVANLHPDDISGQNLPESVVLKGSKDLEDFPKHFDWRDRKNTIGGVGNQGYCGCSWGFTIASLLQSTISIQNSHFLKPSEQQLCDCAQGGNAGCYGGSVQEGLEYVKENGVVTEANYQRNEEREEDFCKTDRDTIKLSSYQYISPATSSQIQKVLLQKGPIGVGFKVSNSFRHYRSGVFTLEDCNDKETFLGWHSVTIIGYGTSETGEDFWIAKNSWSPSFGENGFFRIARNVDLCEFESKMPVFVEI